MVVPRETFVKIDCQVKIKFLPLSPVHTFTDPATYVAGTPSWAHPATSVMLSGTILDVPYLSLGTRVCPPLGYNP